MNSATSFAPNVISDDHKISRKVAQFDCFCFFGVLRVFKAHLIIDRRTNDEDAELLSARGDGVVKPGAAFRGITCGGLRQHVQGFTCERRARSSRTLLLMRLRRTRLLAFPDGRWVRSASLGSSPVAIVLGSRTTREPPLPPTESAPVRLRTVVLAQRTLPILPRRSSQQWNRCRQPSEIRSGIHGGSGPASAPHEHFQVASRCIPWRE